MYIVLLDSSFIHLTHNNGYIYRKERENLTVGSLSDNVGGGDGTGVSPTSGGTFLTVGSAVRSVGGTFVRVGLGVPSQINTGLFVGGSTTRSGVGSGVLGPNAGVGSGVKLGVSSPPVVGLPVLGLGVGAQTSTISQSVLHI